MRKKFLFIFSLVTLVASMAMIPLNSIAQSESGGCTLNGVEIPGDPVEIEGTSSADVIDCRTSPYGHNIHANAGADLVYGSNYDDFIEGGDGNDVFYGEGGNDGRAGSAHRCVHGRRASGRPALRTHRDEARSVFRGARGHLPERLHDLCPRRAQRPGRRLR